MYTLEYGCVEVIKQINRSNQICYNRDFISAYNKYRDAGGKNEDSNILNEKKYAIKDTDASYRSINHWSSLGLLDDVREDNNKGWRKFSIIDIVWLRILIAV